MEHIVRKRSIYLCVTARPMSLLTACGEPRCTATWSSQGERERMRAMIRLCRGRLAFNDVTPVVNHILF